MEMTPPELAEILDPAMTAEQVRTLIWLAAIEPAGARYTGRRGRRPRTYHDDVVRKAHACEAARTAKQFTDNDWIASALLDRALIRADTETGELRWPDGRRAEYLNDDLYGYVKTPPAKVAAHRVIWIAAEGEIPPGLQVNHRNKLRWDNRRANLELVTFSHNVRHGAGTPYLTYHQAVTQLAMVAPPLPEVPCTDNMTRAGGVFQK